MAPQNEEVTQETQNEVPAADETPAASEGSGATDSGAEAPATEGEPTPGEQTDEEKALAAAEQTFKPRDKFKVMVHGSDEQKEHDVPKWLKDAIKDPATEKEAIELLEKAFGLDPVKASRQEIRVERDTVKAELSKVTSSISDLRRTYARGDIDSFLQKLAIPQERMLQWALDKVNYSQLPPDQQRILDERQEAQRQAWAAEQQLSQVSEQSSEQIRQARQMMLTSSLARPEVKSFADSFDAKAGKPGSFFEKVVLAGQTAWNQSQGKVDLSPEQAIEQVMKEWGPFLQHQASSATGTPSGAAGAGAGKAAVIAAPAAKPGVIPNVQGKSSSPMKAKPRSLDDLKKLSEQAQRNG